MCLGLLAATALPMAPVGDWSSSSSSSSSSGSSSSSSSSGSSADWEEFMARCAWNSTATQFGFASIIGAAEPYSRKQIAYKVGPERFSFARLQRDYGTGDASCKATWRFHLRDLRRLHAAMHFPDVIETGHEQVPGEEAFLIMLRRLAYPATWATLAWPAGRSPYALSRCTRAGGGWGGLLSGRHTAAPPTATTQTEVPSSRLPSRYRLATLYPQAHVEPPPPFLTQDIQCYNPIHVRRV